MLNRYFNLWLTVVYVRIRSYRPCHAYYLVVKLIKGIYSPTFLLICMFCFFLRCFCFVFFLFSLQIAGCEFCHSVNVKAMNTSAWRCRLLEGGVAVQDGWMGRKRGEWTVGLAVLWTVFGFALPQKYFTPMCVCVWHVASGSCCCSFGCHFGPSRRVASRCLVLVEIHYAKRTRAATRRVAHATWQTKAAPRDKRNGRSWWQCWQRRQLRLPACLPHNGGGRKGGGEAWQL